MGDEFGQHRSGQLNRQHPVGLNGAVGTWSQRDDHFRSRCGAAVRLRDQANEGMGHQVLTSLDGIVRRGLGHGVSEPPGHLALEQLVHCETGDRIELTAQPPHPGGPVDPGAQPRRSPLTFEPSLAVGFALQRLHTAGDGPLALLRRGLTSEHGERGLLVNQALTLMWLEAAKRPAEGVVDDVSEQPERIHTSIMKEGCVRVGTSATPRESAG